MAVPQRRPKAYLGGINFTGDFFLLALELQPRGKIASRRFGGSAGRGPRRCRGVAPAPSRSSNSPPRSSSYRESITGLRPGMKGAPCAQPERYTQCGGTAGSAYAAARELCRRSLSRGRRRRARSARQPTAAGVLRCPITLKRGTVPLSLFLLQPPRAGGLHFPRKSRLEK